MINNSQVKEEIVKKPKPNLYYLELMDNESMTCPKVWNC